MKGYDPDATHGDDAGLACPHCGEIDRDAWEISTSVPVSRGYAETWCPSCDGKMTVYIARSITYEARRGHLETEPETSPKIDTSAESGVRSKDD